MKNYDMLIEKRGGGTPQQIETETKLPVMEAILGELNIQMEDLFASADKAYRIAEKLEPEPVSDVAKGENPDTFIGLVERFQFVVRLLQSGNIKLQVGLRRIENFTGITTKS